MRKLDIRMFLAENDVWETAYRETFGVVDKFFVVECLTSFGGKQRQASVFKHANEPKVEHVLIPSIAGGSRQEREDGFRDSFHRILRYQIQNDDLVYIADADEVVTTSAWELAEDFVFKRNTEVLSVELPCRHLFANWDGDSNTYWSKFVKGETFLRLGFHNIRWFDNGYNPRIGGVGWHLSYCGGPAYFILKSDAWDNIPAESIASHWWHHVKSRINLHQKATRTDVDFPDSINKHKHLADSLLYYP